MPALCSEDWRSDVHGLNARISGSALRMIHVGMGFGIYPQTPGPFRCFWNQMPLMFRPLHGQNRRQIGMQLHRCRICPNELVYRL